MGLLDTLARMISHDSSGFVQFGIPPTQVKNVQYDATPVAGGGGYFRVWAVEMRVADKTFLADFYPVLHSVVRFDYATKTIELTRITGLDSLKSSTGGNLDLGKVVALNFALTDLVPFQGGTVEISAGLLAMKEKDKVMAAIKLASDFSAMLAVPQLSTVLGIAEPLARNIENIVGLGDNQFRLGYHNTFASANGGGSNNLAPQYIAIIAADNNRPISRDGVGHWVIDDHLVWINPDPNADQSQIPIDRDYMLLRLEVRRSRGDEWSNLTALNTPFVEALRLVATEPEKASAKVKQAMLDALASPDIAESDREAIALLMKQKYVSRKQLLSGGGLESMPVPGELPAPDEAVALPEPGDAAASLDADLGFAQAEAKTISVAELLDV